MKSTTARSERLAASLDETIAAAQARRAREIAHLADLYRALPPSSFQAK